MVVEVNAATHSLLADLRFQFPLRRYQREILELVNIKLERGERQLHIVAPPGAGKTIIGLQMISQFQCPSVILCPNTTIQAQWEQKLELFLPPEMKDFGVQEFIGTHEDRPLKPITVLTYQVLSTPGSELEYIEKLAHKAWIDELTRGLSLSAGAAELRIMELLQNNKRAYQKEMSRHISRLRKKLTEVLDLNEVLHENAIGLIQALRRQNFGLVLFDECHHLTDYWAAVMTHVIARLDNPVVIGLTGTPPEGKSQSQETRYLSIVGDIDYQVPTSALVKEGGLSPFQDLVYFVEPDEKEMNFLEGQHEEFHLLLEELTSREGLSEEDKLPPLTKWIQHRITSLSDKGWDSFSVSDPEMAVAFGRYMWKEKLVVPKGLEFSEIFAQLPMLDDWMLLLEDFALHYLKTSSSASDHKLYESIKASIRKLGYGLTEQGIRRQASPVDRVLAYSENKSRAVGKILEAEYFIMLDRLRAAVVTDFEQMSATSTKAIKGVLDPDAGGAIAVLRQLLLNPVSEFINPCLVTGSLLLFDQRIKDQFVEAARQYIQAEGYSFEIQVTQEADQLYCAMVAGSSEWSTRLYVAMATELFERGITKCLIGTRGIFGEGWDSQALNTLIDLTTTTSPVSVKQLRGRSIRIQTNDPLSKRKVANNWDVVCIAPALEKGLNDYHRFVRKHEGYFGLSDDGHIESGVGHVHPAFSELTPAEVFASLEDFNQEFLRRALVRDKIYDLWKVGQPYSNRFLGCVEVGGLRKIGLTPPFIRKDLKYKLHVQHLRAALNGIWFEYGGLGALVAGLMMLLPQPMAAVMSGLSLISAAYLGRKKFSWLYNRMKVEVCQPNTRESSLNDIGIAVLTSLQQSKILPRQINSDAIIVTVRADGSYRVFLDQVETEHSQVFASSFKEVMAPIINQPYLIPKYEYAFPRSKNEADGERLFFKSYLSGKVEPRIGSYHAVPKLLARSDKGREIFQALWNKHVSPGFIVVTETKPELLEKYFRVGPSLANRLLWE